jgi:hypothetical protein
MRTARAAWPAGRPARLLANNTHHGALRFESRGRTASAVPCSPEIRLPSACVCGGGGAGHAKTWSRCLPVAHVANAANMDPWLRLGPTWADSRAQSSALQCAGFAAVETGIVGESALAVIRVCKQEQHRYATKVLTDVTAARYWAADLQTRKSRYACLQREGRLPIRPCSST